MGRIIRLRADRHHEVQRLLPWYVTGALDLDERDDVAAHLKTCPECLAELRLEQRLDIEVAALPLDVEHDWAAMRRRIEKQNQRPWDALVARLGAAGARASRAWRSGGPWLGWALAAPALVLALVMSPISTVSPFAAKPDRYHVLGASQAPAAGNVVVMFRPDASEKAMREALVSSHARLVDGPTEADAYVLRVPSAERAAALKTLRAEPVVALAQPIDSSAAP
jgi:hypothetical protein